MSRLLEKDAKTKGPTKTFRVDFWSQEGVGPKIRTHRKKGKSSFFFFWCANKGERNISPIFGEFSFLIGLANPPPKSLSSPSQLCVAS